MISDGLLSLPARESGGEHAALQALREVRWPLASAPAFWTAAGLRRLEPISAC